VSRIGYSPVPIIKGVTVAIENAEVKVKGPKGELRIPFILDELNVEADEANIRVERKSESKIARALHGLTRSLIANAVSGVTDGFSKRLDVFGVGYRAEVQGRKLTMHLGYSHPIEYEAPTGIDLATDNAVQGAQARIVVSGIDKQKVGQAAAEIRTKRKPDPYKGKGVRYEDEVINWKAGKTATS
jgi:large subunit ribosomal protein L6